MQVESSKEKMVSQKMEMIHIIKNCTSSSYESLAIDGIIFGRTFIILGIDDGDGFSSFSSIFISGRTIEGRYGKVSGVGISFGRITGGGLFVGLLFVSIWIV